MDLVLQLRHFIAQLVQRTDHLIGQMPRGETAGGGSTGGPGVSRSARRRREFGAGPTIVLGRPPVAARRFPRVTQFRPARPVGWSARRSFGAGPVVAIGIAAVVSRAVTVARLQIGKLGAVF